MRDPNRIHEMLAVLEKVWSKLPDWRLGQLISNAARAFGYEDPFFMEDEKLLECLKESIEILEGDRHAPKYI